MDSPDLKTSQRDLKTPLDDLANHVASLICFIGDDLDARVTEPDTARLYRTLPEAANELGLSAVTLWHAWQEGHFVARSFDGQRTVRVRLNRVEAWKYFKEQGIPMLKHPNVDQNVHDVEQVLTELILAVAADITKRTNAPPPPTPMPPLPTPKPWMTIKEAAEYASLSSDRVRDAIVAGHLQAGDANRGGTNRYYRIKAEWIEEFLTGAHRPRRTKR